jgi:hypothetical protein
MSAAGLAVLAALVAVFAGHDVAAAVDAPAASNELVALTNISRTSNGLSALPRDNRLATVGVARSEDMLARNYFSHYIPPDDHTVVDVLESLGVRFRAGGENIEFNTAIDFTSVQFAATDFMNSSSHRANILNTRWDRLGAGVSQSSDKKMYTVVFMQSLPPTASPAEAEARPRFEAEPVLVPVAAPPPSPRSRGERIDVAMAPTGLMDSLINRLLRLFLNL